MSFITLILLICCVIGYVAQNFFNKLYSVNYTGKEVYATPVFSVFYGLIIALATLCINRFSFQPDLPTLIMGLINGAALFFFNLSFIGASRSGPYSFQSMMVSFGNIIIPLIFTLTYWGESIKIITVIGIVLMLAAFVVFNIKGLHFEDAKKGYWVWIVIVFLANGAYSELIDAQQRVESGSLRAEMIIITFFMSTIISFIYLLIISKGRFVPAFKMNGKTALFMILSSIGACAGINLIMIVLQQMSSAILFPVSAGALMIINAILGFTVLHEKPDRFRICGIILAVIALIVVNL